jgi:precorrin-3B synthase
MTRSLRTPTPYPSLQGGGEQQWRRGACPGLSAPMPTGDGLLVRLLPIGTLRLEAVRALCEAVRTHGNGVIEITARGSIQVRGLSAVSAPRFADAIAALGIAAQDGVPVVCNGLAGLDAAEIIDAAAVAADLRRALADASLAGRLAPKISVAVDGGGLRLDNLAADIRLCAIEAGGEAIFEIGLAGDAAHATKLGTIKPENGVAAVLRLLDVIARRGRRPRARDVIATDGAAPFREAIADLLFTPARPRESGDPELDSRLRGNERSTTIGTHKLHDGSLAIGIGLPFGHTDARTLERLADVAATTGANGVRTAAGRALMIVGLPAANGADLRRAAANLGFIVAADDPRRHVFACAGAPACASAFIAARSIAAEIAEIAAPRLSNDFQIHLSGCDKGCAHAAAAALTIVGGATGCTLVVDGTTHDAPYAVVAPNDLPAALMRHVGERNRKVSHV